MTRPSGKEVVFRYDGVDKEEDDDDTQVDLDIVDPRKVNEYPHEPRREGGRGARKLRPAFYELAYQVRLTKRSSLLHLA